MRDSMISGYRHTVASEGTAGVGQKRCPESRIFDVRCANEMVAGPGAIVHLAYTFLRHHSPRSPMPTKASAEQELIPKIREAVIERVERTTLREVARQVGMTASGLSKFMAGGEPYRKIRRKLEAWYTRTRARVRADQGVPSPDTAAAAIRILAMYAPPGDRGVFVDGILAQVIDLLPPDTTWREEFAAFDGYMRASETDVLSAAETKSSSQP